MKSIKQLIRLRLTKLFYGVSIVTFLSHNANGQVSPTIVTMDRLWCNKTTEAGEDEVYLLVNYRYSNGITGSYQVNNAWDLNDGNEPRRVDRWDLWNGYINPGETVNITVVVMEQDGGKSQEIVNMLQGAVLKAGPVVCAELPITCPYIAAIGGILSAISATGINLTDSDDFLGSFNLSISNTGGFTQVTWGNAVRTTGLYYINENLGIPIQWTMQTSLIGDGSNYYSRWVVHY